VCSGRKRLSRKDLNGDVFVSQTEICNLLMTLGATLSLQTAEGLFIQSPCLNEGVCVCEREGTSTCSGVV